MKGQAFQNLFLFIFLVAIATIASYALVNIYLKNSNLSLAKLDLTQQQSEIPQFAIHDVQYSEFGTVATLSFVLYNLGSTNIPLSGWTLDFTDQNGDVFCSVPVLFANLANNPSLATEISTSVYDYNTNQTLSYGQAIPAQTVAEVNVTLLSTCLNQTIQYSTSNLEMGVRLIISPTQQLDIMECSVNPATGYASCSSLGGTSSLQ
ncbi:hypothetical protein MJ1_0452 [Nanobdella aerobiophila]|uniref:LTD domain-containing protein n=1 Tax=Nanobdella aerobiophila TaxID=2586965 RepID=A0A915WS69_9ARCH|nr:hypothetical protein [Nanobdella aerobiophila]BBL45611.1 hypothetical protein MJ1_0452 [Nanobdella aerobiophila]